jgi:hypothetical protein
MVMGGGSCTIDGEAASCAMAESIFDYGQLINGSKENKTKTTAATATHESGHAQDSTIWNSRANDKSNGLALNVANFRANPSSLSTITYQATEPLAVVQSEQSLDDWLEQLWTRPTRPQQQTESERMRNFRLAVLIWSHKTTQKSLC